MTNGNATPIYTPTRNDLERLFDTQAEQARKDQAARQLSAELPLHVEQILSALSERVRVLETRLASGAVQG